ncbi:MAG: chromate transporter [Sphaerochaeta sp.]|jgi:chromate transporter|nr:chromate transporter [Sphaerochaeta sp.]
MSILLSLFVSFFQIGLFSIGGGYAAMPLIKAQVVDIHGWLNALEFADLVTIAEMTPGPIAINSATFVGMRVAGLAGVVVATLGNIMPSVIIMLILAKLYEKYAKETLLKRILEGVRPVVVAAILTAGLGLLQLAITSFTAPDLFALTLFVLSFFALNSRRIKIGPIVLLGIGALVGIGYSFIL